MTEKEEEANPKPWKVLRCGCVLEKGDFATILSKTCRKHTPKEEKGKKKKKR